MNIFKIIILIIIFITTASKSAIVNQEISRKYFDIFSKSILTEKDVSHYRKIFQFQENCKWKLANKYILNINNKILMGHVLAQRYLHPNCYRSQFLELSNWLKKYNDHPQAKRIYSLAIRRMTKVKKNYLKINYLKKEN